MRTFVVFIALIAAALAAVATLAYPMWLAVAPMLEEPRFHRVASRLAMLTLLVGFVAVARRLRLNDRQSLGYAPARAEFVRELLVGFAIGVLLMLPIVAAMGALGLREFRSGAGFDAPLLASIIATGLVSGFAVAFIEETFLRGAMFTGIARESGLAPAVILTSLLYATLHFFGKYRIPADEIAWTSGVDLIAGWLQGLADPLALVDSFVSLFAVGVLLASIRAATGNIAACIGLHAGWVLIIAVVREMSLPDETHPWSFLVGSYDGLVGWLVFAWTLVIGVGIVAFYRARARRAVRTPRS
jgi:uncharacterized protein